LVFIVVFHGIDLGIISIAWRATSAEGVPDGPISPSFATTLAFCWLDVAALFRNTDAMCKRFPRKQVNAWLP
jgi:hypothetical protein